MDIQEQSIIGEVVAHDYRAASIFKSFGIDFCCKGNRTIASACADKNISLEGVITALQNATQQSHNQATDYHTWPADLLADYIEKKHHRYVENKIQEIRPFLYKVIRVHGGRHPELVETGQLFDLSADELMAHMKKEEWVLFPYIRRMVEAQAAKAPLTAPHFGTVQNPIAMMHLEHEAEGERFRKIAALTNNYTPPEDACNTYRVTFALLKEFEEDLHLHIHLENNILYPKAIAMEKMMA